jgi:hypothetical protein
MGAAWERHDICELTLSKLASYLPKFGDTIKDICLGVFFIRMLKVPLTCNAEMENMEC